MVNDTIPDDDVTFMVCSCCGNVWLSRSDFLSDPDVKIVGYQVDFDRALAGMFFFNHACGTTIAVDVDCMRDLHKSDESSGECRENARNAASCPSKGKYETCPEACESIIVLSILKVVKAWPKGRTET